MQLQREPGTGHYITALTDAGLHVAGRVLRGHAVIGPDAIVEDWHPARPGELTEADLADALRMQPEVILYGSGAIHRHPGIHLVTAVMSRGVGFEVMSTPAACRTFNILLGEYRRVVAVLLVDAPHQREAPSRAGSMR